MIKQATSQINEKSIVLSNQLQLIENESYFGTGQGDSNPVAN